MTIVTLYCLHSVEINMSSCLSVTLCYLKVIGESLKADIYKIKQ
jgi:hypothetical protein